LEQHAFAPVKESSKTPKGGISALLPGHWMDTCQDLLEDEKIIVKQNFTNINNPPIAIFDMNR
jgi:hypothetical protein